MTETTSVIGRASALLRTLASHPGGITTTDLARFTSIPRPTTHRLLDALDAQGLVDRNAQSGLWYLGPEIYVLGAASATRFDVTDKAAECVRRLATETGESAFFSLRRGNQTVVMLREDGDFPIRSHVLFEGARFPLGVVSAGLAVLAYLPESDVAGYLQSTDLAARWGVMHEANAIRARIERTRLDGWAFNPGLIVEGSWGMAAAVFDSGNKPIGALTLTGIQHRFTDGRRPRLGALLLREANQLTKTIIR